LRKEEGVFFSADDAHSVGIVFKRESLADFWGNGDRLIKEEGVFFPQMTQIV
jgi:hypothetical protein